MSRESTWSSGQERHRPPAVTAAADVDRPPRSEQWVGNEAAVVTNARRVQRPNFTAIVSASRSAVHVHGELNVLTVDLVRGAIEHLRAVGHDHITVELAGLVCLDASAMRELGRLQDALRTEGAVVIFLDRPAGLAVAGAQRRDQVTTMRPAPQSPTTAPPIIAEEDPVRNRLRAVPTTGLGPSSPPSHRRRPLRSDTRVIN